MSFKAWWLAATPAERTALAQHCNTSTETLYQTAVGVRVNPKLHRALDIVEGTRALARRNLPAIKLDDLDTRY